ncbi:MAG: Gfo/Idh/MocA family oxidoreductase [Thermotaleaceae bacterium]
MNPIGWGIIGCGDVTEVKSGPGFQKAENSNLVAVMRRNGALAESYAKRHHVPRWYDDGDKLINDPEVDIVYIATPPAYHKEYTIKAAKAGRAVYVEKPMALTYKECQEMIQICQEAEVPLYVAYYRRALPKFIKIKELIDTGVIGEVRFVTVKNYEKPKVKPGEKELPWRVVPEIAGGGIFVDIGCHTLDILDFLLGPIQTVQGSAGNQGYLYRAEDIVAANFVFQSGVQGTGIWCFTAYEDYDMNEIVGSQGKISFPTFGSNPVRLTTENGTIEFPIENPLHIQQPFIQTVVDDLIGKGKCPSTGESAARTSWVMDTILRDYRSIQIQEF